MKTVCAKDMCAGCMACINMCKKSAITIVDDYKTYEVVVRAAPWMVGKKKVKGN